MPRLRNIASGVVVSCSTEAAALLGAEWEPVSDEPEPKRTSSRKTQ